MSGRALRRLREEREAALREENNFDEEESESDDENGGGVKSAGAFVFMEDADSTEDEDEEVECGKEDEEGFVAEEDTEAQKEEIKSTHLATRAPCKEHGEPENEDLDAILAEFESQDKDNAADDSKLAPKSSYFEVITSGLDARDLDFDYVMRTTLLGGAEVPEASGRRSRQTFSFGPPRDGWQKPPHYVGGGIGMTSYDKDQRDLPWPYNKDTDEHKEDSPWKNPKQWYTFMYSDTYLKDLEDYKRVQSSGDANALTLFVSHHPYVTEALLQLTSVLYQINQSQDGLSLLRRILWVYESSSLLGFAPHKDHSCFLDKDQKENEMFFVSLFRLLQVSSIAGCVRTSLAVSRYLLAMDPLRDPMGVLLIMDCFALQTMNDEHCQFLVTLVESARIEIYYRNNSERKEHVGGLLDLPNWAYSYALALYRLGTSRGDENMDQRAIEALMEAVRRFPAVVEQLLVKNELDMTGRSFRTDWPIVLSKLRSVALTPPDKDYDPIMHHATTQAAHVIAKIFVERNCKLWSSNSIVAWLYDASARVTAEEKNLKCSLSLDPSILRYARSDPEDYEDRFRHLPQEANPLDPNLVAAALVVDPNRRRLFRGGGGVARGGEDEQFDPRNRGLLVGHELLIGGPPTHIVDPDDPLLEVFWRSLLPWNHVDGIPPPRR
jgi:Transcriptional repressor TCF25